MNLFTKWEDRIQGHLEVLHAPGNSYNCDAEDEAADEVDEGNLPPAEEYPDEVHHHRYAARFIGAVHQLVAEGPEGVSAQLEELYAKGYADDCDAHQQTDDVVYQGDDDTAEDEPNDVA